ncbi:MAG TPA: saccharopine dehydrogenase NADP-binding domain-containing protein [Polyangiales bacterium]|nr:saccharopine dehydrogenase NADP-binding domain-containing protein [Polyangiales bacterium]
MSRIVLFGATGYTGKLAAHALRRQGFAPLLVARNAERLRALASELGGLDTATADATEPASLKRLLSAGDVLVSTVGPFFKHGAAQLSAALATGAHYVDSCGESAYYRYLFEREREAARAAGCAVLTACAYDFFPGNCAADHVLQLAGSQAVRVEIGYAGEVPPGYKISTGSQASGLATLLEPGLFWRGGRHVVEPVGVRLGSFELWNGSRKPGISMAGTEHLFLPELHPQLRDIDSFWGWAGGATRVVHQVYRAAAAIARRPQLKAWASAALGRLARSDGSGPTDALRERATSFVSAAAYDTHGRKLAVAQLGDVDGFSFTANILAWTAGAISRGALRETGVIGPVQAFGRQQLQQAHAECGFQLQSQLLASTAPAVSPAVSP